MSVLFILFEGSGSIDRPYLIPWRSMIWERRGETRAFLYEIAAHCLQFMEAKPDTWLQRTMIQVARHDE
jgi:hypothetical protein